MPAQGGVVGVHVPQVGLTNLIPQGQNFLLGVHTEPDEPDFAVFIIKFVNYRNFSFSGFEVFLDRSGFPADNGVFTRFGKYKISKPTATIDVVSVNISG